METYEAFEVVRRRLFGEVSDPAERDRTCEAFATMYGRSRSDYPREAAEQRYLERLKACYPIHPEIFDRLYADWSSIPQFQRTRGVLRMLATAVSRLYLDNDHWPLILPASLPLGDPALGAEFVKLLAEQWESSAVRGGQRRLTSRQHRQVAAAVPPRWAAPRGESRGRSFWAAPPAGRCAAWTNGRFGWGRCCRVKAFRSTTKRSAA